ncbi:MAG: hypothetical protein AAF637_13840, partial [Pseudomonadota bacterium]
MTTTMRPSMLKSEGEAGSSAARGDVFDHSGRIGAEDVLHLRRSIYREGGIDRDEAAALFRLNRNPGDHDPAWAEFYVEALGDFFYWREGTDSVLTEDAERVLMEWIGPADALDDGTELRLLLQL